MLSFEQPDVPWWKTATSVAVSLVPIVGEFYDGWTIYAQKDPITGEKLTLLGNAFTIIGLGTVAGSGKVAREVGERAIRELATSKGIDYDIVNSAAEEVIKEADLVTLATKGKAGFDELVRKIGERAVVKSGTKLSKLEVGTVIDGLGIVVKTVPGNLRGYTMHGAERMKERGLTEEIVVKVIANPKIVLKQSNDTMYYLTEEAAVVLNSTSEVVTTYSKNEFYPKVNELLNLIQ